MGTKLGKLVTYRERLLPLKLHDPYKVTRIHVTILKNYISPFTRFMTTKLQRGGSERKRLSRHQLLVFM